MWWRKPEVKPSDELRNLLRDPSLQEEFLGVKNVSLPTPDTIQDDAAKVLAYSHSSDYKVFAKEAWAKVLTSLDIILDDKSSLEKVQYHRASLKATLDLLRISYQARSMLEALNKRE